MRAREVALQRARDLVQLEKVAIQALLKAFVRVEDQALRQGKDFMLLTSDLDDVAKVINEMRMAAHAQSVARVRERTGLLLETKWPITTKALRVLDEDGIGAIERNYGTQTAALMSKLTVDLEKGVRKAAAQAIDSGLPVKSAVKTFFAKSGLDETKYHQFSTIVRTQLQLTYSSAQAQELSKPEIAQQLWGYEYVTVGDSRVRAEHAALDGTRLPKDDPFWRRFLPPNGWNCRCQAIPIFQEEPVIKPPDDVEPQPGFDFEPGNIVLDPINVKEPEIQALPVDELRRRLEGENVGPARRERLLKKIAKAEAREAKKAEKPVKKAGKKAATKKASAKKVVDPAVRAARKAARAAKRAEKRALKVAQKQVDKVVPPTKVKTQVGSAESAITIHATEINKHKADVAKLIELKRVGRENLPPSDRELLDTLDDRVAFNNAKLNRQIHDTIAEASRARETNKATDVEYRATGPTGGKMTHQGAADAADWLNAHGNRDLLKVTMVPVEVSPIARAYTTGTKIVANKACEERVLLHEWAHQYELSYFRVKDRVAEFSKKRQGSEKLSRISPKLMSHEKSYKDDWFKAVAACHYDKSREQLEIIASYVGKDYGGKATEIISVGMELMRANPAAFAAADPEWFDLVEGVMTGRYGQ